MAKSIATNLAQVVSNIERYERELAEFPRLAARISQHPAWYAIKNPAGEWRFGPSKFVGYAENTAKNYLATYYDRADGRETEPALKEWFEEVTETALGAKLRGEFKRFAGEYGKLPNKRWRVSVPRTEIGRGLQAAGGSESKIFSRVFSDPEICGGRPCIRGTRMRVSDIVDMIANGVERAEILADFPYLSDEDISAALRFASRAVDHRIVRAA